jgi:hypothetical protein
MGKLRSQNGADSVTDELRDATLKLVDSEAEAEVLGAMVIRRYSREALCEVIAAAVRPLIEQRDKRIAELETWKKGAEDLDRTNRHLIGRLQKELQEKSDGD